MLGWMRKTMGGADEAGSASIGALEGIFAPIAAKARLDLESRREQVLPIPSPGDRLLADRVLVIRKPPTHVGSDTPQLEQEPLEES